MFYSEGCTRDALIDIGTSLSALLCSYRKATRYFGCPPGFLFATYDVAPHVSTVCVVRALRAMRTQ